MKDLRIEAKSTLTAVELNLEFIPIASSAATCLKNPNCTVFEPGEELYCVIHIYPTHAPTASLYWSFMR